MHLLDVNLLIALADPSHVDHVRVSRWFANIHRLGWATCPLTENGFLRILGHPNYPQGPGSPDVARLILRRLCLLPGHQFWPDAVTLRDLQHFPDLPASRDLTDFYLLALAIDHEARLATLDQRFNPAALPGGPAALLIIPE